jgi:hypothetical protein
MKIKCYGWKSFDMYKNLNIEELLALRKKVEEDPKSQNPLHAKGSIFLYTKAAERKLDAISWAVTYHLQDKKKDNFSKNNGLICENTLELPSVTTTDGELK